MMRYLLFILTLFSSATALALPRYDVLKRVKQLQASGIDTIVFYNTYSAGSITEPGQNWFPAESEYLIWNEHGISYIQRFDDCYRYKPRVIGAAFMKLVINDYDKLKKEEILLTRFRRGKINLFFNTYTLVILHTSYNQFIIYTPSGEVEKTINRYTMNADEDEGNKNLNYAKNQRSLQNRLIKLAERVTAKSMVYVSAADGNEAKINSSPVCRHFKLSN